MSIPEFKSEYATLVADDFEDLKRALQAVSAWIILAENTSTKKLVDISLLSTVKTWLNACKEHMYSIRFPNEMQSYQNALYEAVALLTNAVRSLESGVSGEFSNGTEDALKLLHCAHSKLRYVSKVSPFLSMVDLHLGCCCVQHTKVG